MPAYAADLLSDTLTRPTPAMREAMARAEVGDDVFGEDPDLRALEERVAALLGHEAGLFSPTGSLANQPASGSTSRRGRSSSSTSRRTSCAPSSGGSRVRRHHQQVLAVRTRTTLPLRPAVAGHDRRRPYQVETALAVVENMHNFGGGTVQPIEAICAVRSATRELGVALHLDGARLWNAHVASGVSLTAYGEQFDTVSVRLSMGLGAPVGSVLVGSAEQMAEAWVWRKRYGAGMGQVSIPAAAGLHALDHHVERLADDHARAAACQCLRRGGARQRGCRHGGDEHRRPRGGAAGWSAPEFVTQLPRARHPHVCGGPGARRLAPRRRRHRHGHGHRRRDGSAAYLGRLTHGGRVRQRPGARVVGDLPVTGPPGTRRRTRRRHPGWPRRTRGRGGRCPCRW